MIEEDGKITDNIAVDGLIILTRDDGTSGGMMINKNLSHNMLLSCAMHIIEEVSEKQHIPMFEMLSFLRDQIEQKNTISPLEKSLIRKELMSVLKDEGINLENILEMKSSEMNNTLHNIKEKVIKGVFESFQESVDNKDDEEHECETCTRECEMPPEFKNAIAEGRGVVKRLNVDASALNDDEKEEFVRLLQKLDMKFGSSAGIDIQQLTNASFEDQMKLQYFFKKLGLPSEVVESIGSKDFCRNKSKITTSFH